MMLAGNPTKRDLLERHLNFMHDQMRAIINAMHRVLIVAPGGTVTAPDQHMTVDEAYNMAELYQPMIEQLQQTFDDTNDEMRARVEQEFPEVRAAHTRHPHANKGAGACAAAPHFFVVTFRACSCLTTTRRSRRRCRPS
jgi:hypothetical protein